MPSPRAVPQRAVPSPRAVPAPPAGASSRDAVRLTASDGVLPSWRPGPARDAVLAFVDRVRGAGDAAPVPVEQRVAVFDNDGTLWCEKPMPVQLDFVLRRLVEMAQADPSLAGRQPWKAAVERDAAWLESVITDHYAGDDRKAHVLMAGVLAAHDGVDVEDFEQLAGTFLRTTSNPVLHRSYLECTYRPMVELLDHLAAHGFTSYIASGGGRDFVRPVSDELYGIPRERVIGSTAALAWTGGPDGGTVTHTPVPEYLDDGPEKPVRIWSRVGRRPLLAAGNSNGDGPMLDFARHDGLPSLRLLLRHDDADREFAYTGGAEEALAGAGDRGWTVVSMRDDWATVF
ncbi:Phosphoserine phosphatase [Geodermatophilus aquaeductus]|jgi:phosphoserine phosphatase|uniref:Phosphoserine phosphatase n=1 Tax=Geodermatophilus aquaeductus TaxID=1564161 RepID=A0A521E1C1_9ACTN|nr:Phosphoserine phosphatase [Geodermatophilus aquaeductus]